MTKGRAMLFRGRSAERARCEGALLERWHGVLPIHARSAWMTVAGGHRTSALLAVRDEQGDWRSGVALLTVRARSVPGSYALRVPRAGSTVAPEDCTVVAAALHRIAERSHLLLRLNVEAFSRDASTRQRLVDALLGAGFHAVSRPMGYTHTVVIDLAGKDDAALLASFSERARRHVRARAKHPVVVAPIVEPRWAPRLGELLAASFARTGGLPPALHWEAIIELSRTQPHLSRLAGLFRTDRQHADALVAFAWGCMHGDHAHYDAAGSVRLEDLHLPLGYGPVWDLLCWARDGGASWFDFGGVTVTDVGATDPLGGISDFKRGFSHLTEEVQEELELVPHPRLVRLSEAVSRVVRSFSRRGKVEA